MADCSKTEEFFKELRRACKMMPYNCIGCPAEEFCEFIDNETPETDGFNQATRKAINNLQKWSDEHPLEIDWMKVPVGTPVWVRDRYSDDEDPWVACKFAVYLPKGNRKFATFNDVRGQENSSKLDYWSKCVLADNIDPTPYYKEMV